MVIDYIYLLEGFICVMIFLVVACVPKMMYIAMMNDWRERNE
jgi:hypothetical protein